MSIPLPHWVRCETVETVTVPSRDGTSPAQTIQVIVPAWKDPEDNEVYLDGDSIRIIDDARARCLGLLTTEEIRDLRRSLGLTQRRLSELLQIGEKTWTRWESGRERPSRSMNVVIRALRDGRIDVPYLESQLAGESKQTPDLREPAIIQSGDAARWTDLLAGIRWRPIDESMKACETQKESALNAWIESFVKNTAFSFETHEWKPPQGATAPDNVIPFQKAS